MQPRRSASSKLPKSRLVWGAVAHESKAREKGRRPRPDPTPDTHKGGSLPMIPDERPERTTELWAHLFEGLQGYLVTFTGQQSTRPGARPNELDDTQQRSWRWPEEKDEAA